MKTIIILSILAVLIAATGIVAAKALYTGAQEKGKIEYRIVRDTVLIDRGRSDCNPWYQYQIELGQDSIYLWNNQRLVSVLPYGNSPIDSVLLKDNE